ncbi:hypothetical protein DDZ13_07345 [Coraliomargarita sinensis]|uniref:Uncharacterized protein n=2 Tax=Coraliomargarita sinensis TaxID=2174842 RepID=A0A317ZKJ9_9BACT|nr:hypothetical protein DDZ13_07345 [Coraliomargarita sinensis]
MRRKEQHLERLMREIQKHLTGKKPKTIGAACKLVSKRLKKKPLDLGGGRSYTPSVSTLYRHYSGWRRGPQFAKLYPRYRNPKQRAKDEVVPYLLSKLLEFQRNVDAFADIEEEWASGLAIPGIGRLRDKLQADETKAFPVNLNSLTGHRFTSEELAQIQSIHRAKREIERRSARLKRSVCARLDLKDSRYCKETIAPHEA